MVKSYDNTGLQFVVVAAAFTYDLKKYHAFTNLVLDRFNTATGEKVNFADTDFIDAEGFGEFDTLVYYIRISYPSKSLTPTQKAEFVSALTVIVDEVQKNIADGKKKFSIDGTWLIDGSSFERESKIPISSPPPTSNTGNMILAQASGSLVSNTGNMNLTQGLGSLEGAAETTPIMMNFATEERQESMISTPETTPIMMNFATEESQESMISTPDSQEISVLLETVHTAIFDTNTTIINTYFDTNGTNSRMPKMVQFVYDGRDIDVPLIVLNPPNLFGLAEITIGPAGREYRFRKDTNTSHMFNTMFQTL